MMIKTLVLTRLHSDRTRVLGRLSVFCGLEEQVRFVTLEPPWLDNTPKKSCIPAGKYKIVPRTSPKFGEHLILQDVEGRSYILCHAGNLPGDTEGCILVGSRFADIDHDGLTDISASAAAMGILTRFVTEPSTIVIVNAYD